MKIVASNSLTVSNVNDGTITHYAYAYSADGTDRFSTTYPNLNLLTDSKDFINKDLLGNNQKTSIVSPNSTVLKDGNDTYLKFISTADNQYWLDCYLVSDWSTTPLPEFINANILPNSKYTFSFWAKGTGEHTANTYDKWTAPSNMVFNFTLTNEWKFYSFTVTSSATIPVKNIEFFLRSLKAGTEINVKYPKVEQGSVATPWMPSSSEGTTADLPSYIGQYTDFTQADSANPSDYTWSLIRGNDGKASYIHTAYANSADGTLDFTPDYKSAVGLDILNITKWTKNAPMSNSTYNFTNNVNNSFKVTGKGTGGNEVLSKSFPAKVGDKLRFTVRYTNRLAFGTYTNNGLQFVVNDTYTESYTLASKIVLPKEVTMSTEYHLEYTVTNDNVWMQLIFGDVLDSSQVDFDINIEVENLTNPVKYAYMGTYADTTIADSINPSDYTWLRIKGNDGIDGTNAPTITVKSYTFSAGSKAEIELTGLNAFKQTVYYRGHNVWVFDTITHKLKEFVNCDTYNTMSFSHNSVSTTLADYLASLKDSIVVIASSDADAVDQNVRNVLNCMGGFPDLGTWGSGRIGHVFIGMSKRSDGTYPLQPRQGYEEVINEDGSAPEIGCTLSKGGIVTNGKDGSDGKTPYHHTAYSYSADGTDRFTTAYPNLSLINTSDIIPYANDDPNFQKNKTKTTYLYSRGAVDNNGLYLNNFSRLSPNTTYTQTFNLTFTSGNVTDFYIFSNCSSVNNYSLSINGTVVSTTQPNGNGVISYSFTQNITYAFKIQFSTQATVTAGSYYGWILQPWKATATAYSLKLDHIKLEQGTVATPWMPSITEVKTSDYPSYIGQYTDFIQADSTNLSDYTWTIFKGQDSNAYTAYSWSADGADRFSNTYPNLNLLKGTKTPISITGNNSANQIDLLYPFDNGKTLSNQGFNINDVLTLEFDWHATNPVSGQLFFQWQGMPWGLGLGMPAINLSPTNSSGHVVYTFNVRDGDIASTAVASAIGYRLDYVPNNTVITLENVIIRKAKGSQPWMPSESEAQDQWQDAIPMYIGVGEKDSQNPSDYRWQLNPRYVQASSDSGLSNKAGVDDLASVANTANNALVQAQNAVSNEDYTSWLEHGYQSTIKNLQDVSAQNQKDIKNVDDRTTIVEGFYGEMKVKWNFIDESFSFSEEGMFISNAQSKMSIQITSDKIVFWDNNIDVAFITGEVLNIQKGVFLESATIGNHLITKFSNDSPVTIIRYVGGIT